MKAKSELALFHLTTIEDFLEFESDETSMSDEGELNNKESNNQNINTSALSSYSIPVKRLSRRQLLRHNQRNTSKLLKEALIFIN